MKRVSPSGISAAPLIHVYPQFEPPEDEPWVPVDEWREVWRGRMRIVRNARRARLLKRRGVPMWNVVEKGRRLWMWFVEE